MEVRDLWELPLWHLYYKFHKNKANFEVASDKYPTWSLCVTESGSFSFDIEDFSGVCHPYELLICPPGKQFSRRTIESIDLHFFHIHFGDEETHQEDIKNIPSGKMHLANVKRLASTLDMLHPLSGKNGDYQHQYKDHLLNDIWQIILSEHLLVENSIFDTHDYILSKALALMRQYAFSKFSLEQIAKMVNISQSQFTRKFRQAFAMTPIGYITTLRLRKAKQLLRNPNIKMHEIAQSCGFDNEYYFSRVFKGHEDIAPSTYRTRIQELF